MKVRAVLNRDAGTLATGDMEAFAGHVRREFEERGHDVEIDVVHGREVAARLKAAGEDGQCDVILAAGGDGTISGAAVTCREHGKALAVVPGGTMNLFARSLSVPLDIYEAVTALAAGQTGKVDVATANGRLLLHQYSVGMQHDMVRLRSRMEYQSRIGKILSSVRSILRVLRRPRVFDVEVELDGKSRRRSLSVLAVSNNLHGEGHLPYADDLTRHRLGVYMAEKLSVTEGARMVTDLVVGTWRTNEDLEWTEASRAVLRFGARHRPRRALIDGEVCELEDEVVLESVAGGLTVLLPSQNDATTAGNLDAK
ncbi:MAG: diacylglycerol kinase [Nitratireductor sp.]|nr:diacylglycerol kinase [Nitratireductor sp.]MCC0020380.1 diacylglycerol kinase [Nitratireductor sp.]